MNETYDMNSIKSDLAGDKEVKEALERLGEEINVLDNAFNALFHSGSQEDYYQKLSAVVESFKGVDYRIDEVFAQMFKKITDKNAGIKHKTIKLWREGAKYWLQEARKILNESFGGTSHYKGKSRPNTPSKKKFEARLRNLREDVVDLYRNLNF